MKLKNKIFVIVLSSLLISCSNVDKAEKYAYKDDVKIERLKDNNVQKELGILYGEDDPLGGLNRRIYYFNGMADRYVLNPVITKYKYYTPDFFQKRLSNFFNNFENIGYALNSFLQLKITDGIETVVRFGINSTVGILGLFDPATSIGIPVHRETLGTTLSYYGVGRGPYVVLPLLGPSNLRDSLAMGVNSYAVNSLDVYHPVHIDFGEFYMLALYGFSTKADSEIYFMESDYVFEYEYMRFLGKKYTDVFEKKSKNREIEVQ